MKLIISQIFIHSPIPVQGLQDGLLLTYKNDYILFLISKFMDITPTNAPIGKAAVKSIIKP